MSSFLIAWFHSDSFKKKKKKTVCDVAIFSRIARKNILHEDFSGAVFPYSTGFNRNWKLDPLSLNRVVASCGLGGVYLSLCGRIITQHCPPLPSTQTPSTHWEGFFLTESMSHVPVPVRTVSAIKPRHSWPQICFRKIFHLETVFCSLVQSLCLAKCPIGSRISIKVSLWNDLIKCDVGIVCVYT